MATCETAFNSRTNRSVRTNLCTSQPTNCPADRPIIVQMGINGLDRWACASGNSNNNFPSKATSASTGSSVLLYPYGTTLGHGSNHAQRESQICPHDRPNVRNLGSGSNRRWWCAL
jgi:hypothetical protein